MPSVSVRYIVDDVDAAIEFYSGLLGFQEDSIRRLPSPCFRAVICAFNPVELFEPTRPEASLSRS
jgi:catechol 2,3-dioxygenase-like lactoylglutathione lyase family enzyme